VAARFSKVISAAASYGITVEKPSGGGSHWKAKKAGFRTYPIPAHRGKKTVIGDEYIRGLCRNFALDLNEFLSKL
jgi:hypothetical protein